ncbi:MAG TPA: ABC transporter permease [Aromatoleum sp.]|uniref:ABC transporter permease n=1 Tax=Aromatoleum sp. TaxID=2307007 RepID=UPI002B4706E3|nr:ABC transporter permease [Aromatoleum sp.]HJV28222.1 ABC transporter permease [Aromatoleum sp.]
MSDFAYATAAVANAEIRKLMRDPTELVSRAVQPVLWLAVFGQVFSKVRGIPTGDIGYLDFMAPGILAQSILFSAIFYGIAIIWERDLGIIHKLLVTPASRVALVLGKGIAAGLRGLIQAVVVYLIAFALHIGIRWDLPAMVGVACAVFLGSCIFATFSLVIACIVKTRERFMGIGQVLTMPLFFASNAIYPIELMPGWLRTIAVANPLTYLVDALRHSMIVGGHGMYTLATSFEVMAAAFLLLLAVATKLYPGLVR